jgi:hypothetical protein
MSESQLLYLLGAVLVVLPFAADSLRRSRNYYMHELLKALWLLRVQGSERQLEKLGRNGGDRFEIGELDQALVQLRIIDAAISHLQTDVAERYTLRRRTKRLLREAGVMRTPGFPRFPVIREEEASDGSKRIAALDRITAGRDLVRVTG